MDFLYCSICQYAMFYEHTVLFLFLLSCYILKLSSVIFPSFVFLVQDSSGYLSSRLAPCKLQNFFYSYEECHNYLESNGDEQEDFLVNMIFLMFHYPNA